MSSECVSGECDGWHCVMSCSSDEDCTADVFTGACTNGFCEFACTGERTRLYGDRLCVGGREIECAELDDSYCDVCEGRCPGQRCVMQVGCAPLSNVGEPCDSDSDCRTNNCSLFAGVCRVPLETDCDDTNCDLCISDGPWSYCSRECRSTSDCPGERCAGSSGGPTKTDYFYCRPPCTAACPGECTSNTSGTRLCTAPAGVSWSMSDPTRPLLAPCRYQAHCGDAECAAAPSCVRPRLACGTDRGYCTTECSSDAECGADGNCVMLSCPPGVTEGCGMRCLPSCELNPICSSIAGAHCSELPNALGQLVRVCDPRNRLTAYCTQHQHCASSNCSSTFQCVAAEGSSNGTPCGVASDCASGNCQAGTCRGTSLRGDPCGQSADCSVGACVSGVCD